MRLKFFGREYSVSGNFSCVCVAPRLAGFSLKCFCWLLEMRMTNALILAYMRKANLITEVSSLAAFYSFFFSLQCLSVERCSFCHVMGGRLLSFRYSRRRSIPSHPCTHRNILVQSPLIWTALFLSTSGIHSAPWFGQLHLSTSLCT